MKTSIRFAVLLSLLVLYSAVCFSQTESGVERVQVSKDQAELRSGPSETAKVMSSLQKGMILDVRTRISTKWLLVKSDNDLIGYVNADDVFPVKEIEYCKFEDEQKANEGGGNYNGVKINATEIPGKAESITLAKDTLLAFNDALIAKDFTMFRNNSISEKWRNKVKAEDFKTGFKEFLDREIEIGRISKLDPEFNPCPNIGTKYEQEVLYLKGVFITFPLPVNFSLEYIREDVIGDSFLLESTRSLSDLWALL